MQQLSILYKEQELWDLGFYSWIENSGLGGDQSSTFGFKEARIYGILISQDIFRTRLKQSEFLMLITKNQYFGLD